MTAASPPSGAAGRRRLLAGAAAGALATLWPARSRVWAAPAAVDARLVFVLLRGAYDALTLLVPRSSFYAEVRPTLAVPIAAADDPAARSGARPLDADWALHPAADGPLAGLLQAGQLAFVPFAGLEHPSRSHFEMQDLLEMAPAPGARLDAQSGFLNRLAQVLGAGDPLAAASATGPIAFSAQLPLALRGPVPVANTSLRRAPRRAGTAPRLEGAIAQAWQGHALQGRVDEGFALRAEVSRQLAEEMQAADRAADRAAISAGGFEAEARRIGRVLRQGHALGFVDVGGWDTHVAQGGLSGALPNRLGELARGLAALAEALGPAEWARTVVVVGSEFGRTVRENGGRGTDHGHGSTWLVLGGGLSAGLGQRPVVGRQQAIAAGSLHQDRDLPVLNGHRELLAGLLARQHGLSPAQLQWVLPGAVPADLGLI